MFRKIVCLQAILFLCIMVLPVASAFAGPGCKDLPGEPGYYPDLEMESGGMTRIYNLYVPPKYKDNKPTALVLNFHGYGGTHDSQEAYSQLLEKADKYKFILVSPLGIGNSWNAGGCCGQAVEENIDDVGFASDLIDKISADYCVDPARVFSTGMSNGGFISYRLACELSDRIAAIAPVAGTNRMPTCEPTRPVPVIAFNGTADPLVQHGPAKETIEWWADHNGCTDEMTEVFQNGDVTCDAYEECQEDAAVVFCSIEGGGHNWPGSYDLCEIRPDTCWWSGYTSLYIDAALEMSKFFAKHPMPEYTKKAKVAWDHDDLKIDGNIYFPAGFWQDGLDPAGSVVVTLAGKEVVNQDVTFAVKGKKDDKWEYKDKKLLFGDIKDFKIDWKGAKSDRAGSAKFKLTSAFDAGLFPDGTDTLPDTLEFKIMLGDHMYPATVSDLVVSWKKKNDKHWESK